MWRESGRAALAAGKPKDAVARLSAAAKAKPKDGETRLLLIDALIRQGSRGLTIVNNNAGNADAAVVGKVCRWLLESPDAAALNGTNVMELFVFANDAAGQVAQAERGRPGLLDHLDCSVQQRAPQIAVVVGPLPHPPSVTSHPDPAILDLWLALRP